MTRWSTIFKEGGFSMEEPHQDIPQIAKLFKKKKIKRILDLGCGKGRHVVYLVTNGFDVYGTDNAKEGIKLCKEWLRRLDLRANLKIASFFKKFPFKDNFFEAVISIWSIHHGKEKQVKYCIEEIERVLKPGGLIFISVTATIKRSTVKKAKKIEPHTYEVLEGLEKGVPHYIFTKKIVKDYFKNFEILDLHLDKSKHWCILGKLQK